MERPISLALGRYLMVHCLLFVNTFIFFFASVLKFGYMCRMIMTLKILGDAENFIIIFKLVSKFPDLFFFKDRKHKLRKTWN